MIEIKDKSKCCGCTACQSVCPKKCIEMIPDEEGFLYPKIDHSKCVNCEACEKVCPFISGFKKNPTIESFVVRNADRKSVV